GRTDVFPRRWQNAKTGKKGFSPACRNEWVPGVCQKPKVKCSDCVHQAFVPVDDDIIAQHLRGTPGSGSDRGDEFVIGVYPILPDISCWFLAVDFDGKTWESDETSYLDSCRAHQIEAALERSRSGNGGHVWTFFSEPIPSSTARQLGTLLMTAALDRRPEIGFPSYDRFFPNQDTLPAGGFGNLIALPLQELPRRAGNTVFIDDDFKPYEDQWAYLSSLGRTSLKKAEELVDDAVAKGDLLRVRLPIDEDDSVDPWELPPSRKPRKIDIAEPLPSALNITIADQVYVERADLPSAMVASLVRVAAFQNPEFYRAQAMRLPTHGKPRVISCAELHAHHIALPRGCLDEVINLLAAHDIKADLDDKRDAGRGIDAEFTGVLRPQQIKAVDAVASHDFGVLAATTAFGKTVVAAALIARRKLNTLILVHRRELLEQWTERLKAFLSVDNRDIGVIGAGKQKPTERIDVAMIQSLVRRGEVSDIVAGYGQIIVDECHHLPAVSFELVARRSKAKYVLGLSATVVRKDGHHPIIFMQCGPIRHRVDAKSQATRSSFEHRVVIKETSFRSS
ncbi:MAG: DEAD/DEAH box helicase family protein, partial [Pseudomonadota bacterium]